MSKQGFLNIKTLEGLDIEANGEKYDFLCEYNGINGDIYPLIEKEVEGDKLSILTRVSAYFNFT